MEKILLKLNTIEKVRAFVDRAKECEVNAYLYSGHARANANSILGILSLNLTKPIAMMSGGNTNTEEIREEFRDFLWNK